MPLPSRSKPNRERRTASVDDRDVPPRACTSAAAALISALKATTFARACALRHGQHLKHGDRRPGAVGADQIRRPRRPAGVGRPGPHCVTSAAAGVRRCWSRPAVATAMSAPVSASVRAGDELANCARSVDRVRSVPWPISGCRCCRATPSGRSGSARARTPGSPPRRGGAAQDQELGVAPVGRSGHELVGDILGRAVEDGLDVLTRHAVPTFVRVAAEADPVDHAPPGRAAVPVRRRSGTAKPAVHRCGSFARARRATTRARSPPGPPPGRHEARRCSRPGACRRRPRAASGSALRLAPSAASAHRVQRASEIGNLRTMPDSRIRPVTDPRRHGAVLLGDVAWRGRKNLQIANGGLHVGHVLPLGAVEVQAVVEGLQTDAEDLRRHVLLPSARA